MKTLEKAILKTLIYSDIFDFPLKGWEAHKWLIGEKANLHRIEEGLAKLVKNKKVVEKQGYFSLNGREQLIVGRLRREKTAREFNTTARRVARILKVIPWIKLVGISGGLAIENVSKKDDIDFFVVTDVGRIWISRLMILGLLSALGLRRKRSDNRAIAAGKICVNMVVDYEHLAQSRQDLYVAHEVLQMRVLWQRDQIYSKYLLDNEWTQDFLPNWTASQKIESLKGYGKWAVARKEFSTFRRGGDLIEYIARQIQLKIMGRPQGLERIDEGAFYFHPLDYQGQVLSEYKKRVQKRV